MRYTKKPITIEAVQFTGQSMYDLDDFMDGSDAFSFHKDGTISVITNHGGAKVEKGDWIVKSPSGEFYPCKPDVFKETYVDASAKDADGTKKVLDFAASLGLSPDDISDGYHSFQDLYDHRKAAFVALTKSFSSTCWRSKLHFDGTMHEGYFIVGIGEEAGEQITYHYEMKHWELFDHCPEITQAPEFDGHTAEDVVERLLKL